jgi:hypothetical protein
MHAAKPPSSFPRSFGRVTPDSAPPIERATETIRPSQTFREKYCARFDVPMERFEKKLVWDSLNWPAKLIWWWRWIDRDFFAPDFELARAVAPMTKRRGFWSVISDFPYHPGNQGLLRKTFHLRVSSARLHRILQRELPEDSAS